METPDTEQNESRALDRLNRLFKMKAPSLDGAINHLDDWVNKKNNGINDLNYKLFYFDSIQELSKDIILEEEEEEEEFSYEFEDNQSPNNEMSQKAQHREDVAQPAIGCVKPKLQSNIEIQTIPLIIPEVPDVPTPKQKKLSFMQYFLVITICAFVFCFGKHDLF